jgi:hypothetical protein
MADFRELYSTIHGCKAEEFPQQIFCACLSRKALLPGRWLADHPAFRPERELISALSRTTSWVQFSEELHYFTNRRSLNWWRRKAGLRLSTRRLRALGEACFAAGNVERRSSPVAA